MGIVLQPTYQFRRLASTRGWRRPTLSPSVPQAGLTSSNLAIQVSSVLATRFCCYEKKKNLDKRTLRKEGFLLAHRWKAQSNPGEDVITAQE